MTLGALAHPPGAGDPVMEPPDTSKELGKYEAFAAARRFQLENASLMPGLPEMPGLLVGRVRVPVILVCFPDTPEMDKVPPKMISERFFGTEDPSARSVKRYLSEVSHGRIDLSGTVTPWISMPENLGHYMAGGYLNREFFETLSTKLPNYLNIADFDCDDLELDAPPKRDDNEVDGPIILLPSELRTITDQPGDITAYRSWTEWTSSRGWDPSRNHGPILCDGVKLSSYCVSSVFKHKALFHDLTKQQLFDIGVAAHEVLHIYGLPDLYNSTNGMGVGGWCAMGWGVYGKEGSKAAMDETSPMLLGPLARGWISPEMEKMAKRDGIYECEPASFRGRFWRIPIDKNNPQRALLVEFRNATGSVNLADPPNAQDWDQQVNVPGFLIWEVDEGVGLAGKIRRNKMFSDDGRCLVRVVQQDNPFADELPSPAISFSDLWTKKDQSYHHPGSGIVLSKFDVDKRQFTISHAGGPPGAPGTPVITEVADGAAPVPEAINDQQFLLGLDASLDRLAKIAVETIDTEPGLKHREALRSLHLSLQKGRESDSEAANVSLKPNEMPTTQAESQLAKIDPEYREKFEVTGTLRDDSGTFSALKNLTLPGEGTLDEKLNHQWEHLQGKMGVPTGVKWASRLQMDEEVTVAGNQASETSKSRLGEILRSPHVRTKDGKNLQIFGAEFLSKVNADGSADHEWIAAVNPDKLEELAKELTERSTDITRNMVEEYAHKNFKLGTQLSGDDWKFSQGFDASDGREVWQVEIPLVSGRGSLLIDVARNKQTKALEILRPPR